MAQEPLILLLDEPTTYLDGESRSEIMETIRSIHRQRGLTTLETSKNRNILAIQIETSISPKSLIAQARKISKVLKTEKEEQAWEERFLEKLKGLQKQISSFSGKRAVVHRFAQPFAHWAGLSIVQVISPGELTPKVIGGAIAKKPELVLDIHHFPIAKVIAENAKCKYVQVINFPGVGNTKNLEDLFQYNSIQLLNAFQEILMNHHIFGFYCSKTL
ncbi:MAG: hypothetical protein AB1502_16420 [Thermodesulfobacteriota bacterium]